jgi:hypothetical protein
MLCHIRICNHSCEGNESKSTCSGCLGEPGQSPAPSPLLRWRSCWGGEEGGGPGLAWGFWAGKGGSLASKYPSCNGSYFWRLNSAGWNRTLIRQVATADFSGGSFWRVILAHLFGGFPWQVNQSSFKEKQSKEKRSKLCTFSGPVDRIINIVYSQ